MVYISLKKRIVKNLQEAYQDSRYSVVTKIVRFWNPYSNNDTYSV